MNELIKETYERNKFIDYMQYLHVDMSDRDTGITHPCGEQMICF